MNPQQYQRSMELLSVSTSRLLLIDMQEKLAPIVREPDRVISNCRLLAEAARILDVARVSTEQYPERLGSTVDELIEYFPERPDKLRFSSAEALASMEPPSNKEIFQTVVTGIETHVCVAQTVFDLLSIGQRVFVVADATSSRFEADHCFAIDRMRDAGAVITSAEAVLFEWCEVAGTDEFKQISRLVKERTV